MSELAPSPARAPWLLRHRRAMLLAGPVILLLVVAGFYLTGGRTVSTDDAYVQIARTEISSIVSGKVVQLLVKDNQRVRQGDVLFIIDERPLVIAVAAAKAQLAAARLQIAALKATYRQRQADRRSADELIALRQTELERQKKLTAAGISPQSQLDQARYALTTAQSDLAARLDLVDNTVASLNGNPDIAAEDHPMVQQAQAELDRALLMLSYATIHAPSDGIVTKVEQLQVGDYVTASTPVFQLLSAQSAWVEANFKETDLTFMRDGQSARIAVDSDPDHPLTGKVQSFSPGTGSAFALLPPENATGNWVKVVQRLPVRIALDPVPPSLPLRSGLSAVVSVDTGHRRSLFGLTWQ